MPFSPYKLIYCRVPHVGSNQNHLRTNCMNSSTVRMEHMNAILEVLPIHIKTLHNGVIVASVPIETFEFYAAMKFSREKSG